MFKFFGPKLSDKTCTGVEYRVTQSDSRSRTICGAKLNSLSGEALGNPLATAAPPWKNRCLQPHVDWAIS
jgi:hypothetical protein